jgi:hypothetical protein
MVRGTCANDDNVGIVSIVRAPSFEWDEKKNRTNRKKHAVSFEEAQTVFLDDNALEFFDPDHSEEEERFLLLGISARLRVVVVSHCYRTRESKIRIISARKATKRERRTYAGGGK